MFENRVLFDRRVRSLTRKHNAMSRGYVITMRKDGLIVVQPRRKSIQIPYKHMAITLVALVALKAFLMTALGPTTYDNRVTELATGTTVEQAGAWVMQTEPVSEFVADNLRSVYR